MLKDKLSKEAKQGQKNVLSNKRGCPRKTNVGLDRVSIVLWDWSMDNIQTHAWTCRQACKNAKKQRKPGRWHKASKASITTLQGVEKGVY